MSRLREAGVLLAPSVVLAFACIALIHVTYLNRTELLQTASPASAAESKVEKGNADLARAQRDLWNALPVSQKAREEMLIGIGGWGSGEEDDNNQTWEVAMHVDRGCHDLLDLRAEGNPGWKRYPTVKCDANKRVNPYMWPYDAPGKVWMHDSTDSSKTPDTWPYVLSDLHDHVYSATPTPLWADGIWHGDDFDRRIASDGYGVGGPPAEEEEEEEPTPPEDGPPEAPTPPAAEEEEPDDYRAPMQSLAQSQPWKWDGTNWHTAELEKQMTMQHELRQQGWGEDRLVPRTAGLALPPQAQQLSQEDAWHWDGTDYHGAEVEKQMVMQHEMRNNLWGPDHTGLWRGRSAAAGNRQQALAQEDAWHWDGTNYHGAEVEKQMVMQHELRNGLWGPDHTGLAKGRFSSAAPRGAPMPDGFN